MGVMEGLQPGFGGGRLLQDPLPCFFCLIPVIRNDVDELNPTDQMLVRRLRVDDVLTNVNEARQYRVSQL